MVPSTSQKQNVSCALATRVCDNFTGEVCSTAATTVDNFVPEVILEQSRCAWRINSISCFTSSHQHRQTSNKRT